MSRDCQETGTTLITPHIELDLIENFKFIGSGGINASAFEKALGFVQLTVNHERGPLVLPNKHYLVYGVVGRIVNNHSWPYLNIGEPAISRTLMGYLTEEVVKRDLPRTFKEFSDLKKI
jgi:hypothetical protein